MSTAATPHTGSFADRVDFSLIYDGLKQKGIEFSDEEKARFEKIAKDELKQRDPGSKIGTNPGADLQSLGIFILALFKKLFGGGGDLSGILSNAGDSFEAAANETNFVKFNYALQNIHSRLAHSGNSNFKRAADLITGQHEGRGKPEDMQGSIFNQLVGDINIPYGTPTSLDTHATAGDLASPPHRLPRARTRALT